MIVIPKDHCSHGNCDIHELPSKGCWVRTITRTLSLSVWGVLRKPVLHSSSCFILHLSNVPVYKPQVVIRTKL